MASTALRAPAAFAFGHETVEGALQGALASVSWGGGGAAFQAETGAVSEAEAVGGTLVLRTTFKTCCPRTPATWPSKTPKPACE